MEETKQVDRMNQVIQVKKRKQVRQVIKVKQVNQVYSISSKGVLAYQGHICKVSANAQSVTD